MKTAFGNSCAKGCMIYAVALAAILAVTVFGLGGISARFGGANANVQQPASTQGTQNSQPDSAPVPTVSLQVTTQGDQAQAVPDLLLPANIDPNSVPGGGVLSTPTPMPPLPAMEVQPAIAVPQPQPGGETPPPGPTGEATPQIFTPVEAQGGVITGEASTPFYVVQPGDTLWEIATRYGVDVEALSSVNNLQGDTIFPAQVLFLPQGSAPLQVPVEVQPTQPVIDQGSSDPPPSTADPPVPEMPNTGINKKR